MSVFHSTWLLGRDGDVCYSLDPVLLQCLPVVEGLPAVKQVLKVAELIAGNAVHFHYYILDFSGVVAEDRSRLFIS